VRGAVTTFLQRSLSTSRITLRRERLIASAWLSRQGLISCAGVKAVSRSNSRNRAGATSARPPCGALFCARPAMPSANAIPSARCSRVGHILARQRLFCAPSGVSLPVGVEPHDPLSSGCRICGAASSASQRIDSQRLTLTATILPAFVTTLKVVVCAGRTGSLFGIRHSCVINVPALAWPDARS